MKESYLFDTDAYKVSHYLQYPPNTSSMFSYIEARKGGEYDATIFFGLQYFLKEYLSYRVSMSDIEEAKEFYADYGEPFNYEGWKYIATELNGKLPVRIRAVSEGTLVPTGNVLVSIESTDPKVFWIASWLETMMLRYVWYGTTVATRSHKIKQIISEGLRQSSDNAEAELPFKLVDFGARGVSSQESAMIGGAAHLINFVSSDTCVASRFITRYYQTKKPAGSIPAAEHSSIVSWGKNREVDAYRNMLTQFAKPGALVAIVSDSYDLWNAITQHFGTTLKEEILNLGATVIIRPDSGHPPSVVLKSLQLLDEKFGSTINSKGYKVLNTVRVIQGDGISEHSIQEIINTVLDNGYSLTNVAFGMGGQLLQALDRDTCRWAMKCSSVIVDGESRDVSKDPATDHTKKSKEGRLDLIRWSDGTYETVKLGECDYNAATVMRTVYLNGELLVDDNFELIRNRANQ
jgi:nicotinamide phosphoribosyltransferase